jgi:formylglycine-generating enzyme required for sulfatase activity
MSRIAELELGIYPSGEQRYRMRLRFTQPENAAETSQSCEVVLPTNLLSRSPGFDPAGYGASLSACLFGNSDFNSAWHSARAAAAVLGLPVRVRLYIDPAVSELNRLAWETLLDPDQNVPLFTGEKLLFSRFISSSTPFQFERPLREQLRALVVIANPSDLADYNLIPIDVAGELKTVQSGLPGIQLTTLAAPGEATMDAIIEHLRSGVDLLYLVAHGGVFSRSKAAFVMLEDDNGQASPVEVSEINARLAELQELPLLAILVSCESAGVEDRSTDERPTNALLLLGPALASAGIPAVLAMQGQVSFDSMERFLPVFFEELQRHGEIDRALSAARGAIRQQVDWWMPALFSRLRDNFLLEPQPAAMPITLQPFEPETSFIPAGSFWMGSDSSDPAARWETPRHEAMLTGYRIALEPITNQQYARFIQQVRQVVNPEMGWNGQTPPANTLDQPATGMTWFQAMAYCQWLSSATGRRYTLPNEAQWEKAALRGTFTPGPLREWTCSLWGQRYSEPDFIYPWHDDERNDPGANPLVRRIFRSGAAGEPGAGSCSARAGFLPDKPGPPGKRHGFRVVLLP